MSSRTPDRYFVFLRAINVGDRRLTNDDLMRPFIDLGFLDVSAYQASGNITFRTDEPGAVTTDAIEAALCAELGFEIPAFARTRDHLHAIVGARPFDDRVLAGTEGRVQVAFLRSAPDQAAVAEALALVPEGDRVVFSGREWFWLPTRGISGSRLPVGRIESVVGPMTIRTLGTVSRMLESFG